MISESMFVGRRKELQSLNEIYKSNKAELVLLYGRRRVGKTRLIKEFLKDKEGYYFIADLSGDNLSVFSKNIKGKFVRFSNWDDFFEFLCSISKKRIVVAIDEFQYLYNSDKAWPSILQRWWEKLKDTKICLILSGSIISTIYKIAMGYGSALYGRKTYEMELKPLYFSESSAFFSNYNKEERIIAYSVLGGVPRYLEEFDDSKTIKGNLKENVFNNISFLYREPLNLFYEEFKNPSVYVSIINAVGARTRKFSHIVDISGISQNKLSKYLEILERVKIIRKEIPVTENKFRTRATLYSISDNFYRFWFQYVRINTSRIEFGEGAEVAEEITPDLPAFIGFPFEDISKQFLIENRDKLPFKFTKIGRWWHKDKEIDLVALDENKKQICLFEVKWKDLKEKQAMKILEELKEKSKYVEWKQGRRKEYFGLLAKKIENKNSLRKEGYEVFDLEDF
ncbi:MAG: ATP-binding protein [Candidatus Nanohalarchaeota archaeon]|nr:MAG: ATP-binding protein [Candidatus Nanohaloarchaeota archaeon]